MTSESFQSGIDSHAEVIFDPEVRTEVNCGTQHKHSSMPLVIVAAVLIGAASSFCYATFHAPGGMPEAWEWETSIFYAYGISNVLAVILVPVFQKRCGLTTPALGIVMLLANTIGYMLFAFAFWWSTLSWPLAMLGRAINGLGGDGTVIFGQLLIWEVAGGGPHETLATGIFFMMVSGLGSGCSFALLMGLRDALGKRAALASLFVWGGLAWGFFAAHYRVVKPLIPWSGREPDASPTGDHEGEESSVGAEYQGPSLHAKMSAAGWYAKGQLVLLAFVELIPVGGFQYVAINFWPEYLVNFRGVDEVLASTISGMVYIIITFLAPIWGYLLDRVSADRQRVAQIVALIGGCVLSLVGVVQLLVAAGAEAPACALIGIGLSPLESMAAVLVNNYAQEAGYSTTAAYAYVVSLPLSVGILIAPFLVFSDAALIQASAAAMLAGSLLGTALLAGERLRQRASTVDEEEWGITAYIADNFDKED